MKDSVKEAREAWDAAVAESRRAVEAHGKATALVGVTHAKVRLAYRALQDAVEESGQ